MEEKCPQCAAPLKRATEINSLIETEIIECEYCGYTCKIDPKMKKTAALLNTPNVLARNKRIRDREYREERQRIEDQKSEKQKKKESRDRLLLYMFPIICVILCMLIDMLRK